VGDKIDETHVEEKILEKNVRNPIVDGRKKTQPSVQRL